MARRSGSGFDETVLDGFLETRLETLCDPSSDDGGDDVCCGTGSLAI